MEEDVGGPSFAAFAARSFSSRSFLEMVIDFDMKD